MHHFQGLIDALRRWWWWRKLLRERIPTVTVVSITYDATRKRFVVKDCA